jgi:hypothetical protein
MQYNQAVDFFEAQRATYKIPLIAVFNSIEKRIVEMEIPAQDAMDKRYADVLTWVCRYYDKTDMRLYELTGTMDGKIIRYDATT